MTIDEARAAIGKTATCSCCGRTGVISRTSEYFVLIEVPDLPAEHIAIPETLSLATTAEAAEAAR